MRDINDLVQEFWRLSSDGAVGASFFAMYRLHGILKECLDISEVCFDIISIFATTVHLADKNLQMMSNFITRLEMLLDEYREMLDQSFSKFKDLDDMLRILPGVVVQRRMSIHGMADLYRIKPDVLESLIKSTIGPLKPRHVSHSSLYTLDDYLSGFLQDQDRSQLYYCDPMLQNISICRHFLSLLNGFNAVDLQS